MTADSSCKRGMCREGGLRSQGRGRARDLISGGNDFPADQDLGRDGIARDRGNMRIPVTP